LQAIADNVFFYVVTTTTTLTTTLGTFFIILDGFYSRLFLYIKATLFEFSIDIAMHFEYNIGKERKRGILQSNNAIWVRGKE
jgi:hypothetical protein